VGAEDVVDGEKGSVTERYSTTGLLMQQLKQPEQALHALLSAGVGLALVNVLDTSIFDEILRQLRTRTDESITCTDLMSRNVCRSYAVCSMPGNDHGSDTFPALWTMKRYLWYNIGGVGHHP
jgi:hypothetical protein